MGRDRGGGRDRWRGTQGGSVFVYLRLLCVCLVGFIVESSVKDEV